MGKCWLFSRFICQVVVALTVLSASHQTLGAEDRSHPLLIDPAQTKCAVCHKELQGSHHVGVAQNSCLGCHSFVKQDAGTFVKLVGEPPPLEAPATAGEDEEVDRVTQHEEYVVSAPALGPPAPSAAVADTGTEPARLPDDLYAKGLAAFENADFETAFGSWREMLGMRNGMFTIQVEMDDHLESAQTTLRNSRATGFYVVRKGGKYHVLSGFYLSREEAVAAVQLLPKALRAGGAFPIAVAKVLRD